MSKEIKKIDMLRPVKRVLTLMLTGLICAGVCFWGGTETVKADTYWPSGIEVNAASAIVMEANTGTILYGKNIHTQRYPASITKVMTTMLTLENCELDETVTFSKDAVYSTEGSSIYRNVGEQMSMEDTLYAVMLNSANECAYAVGEHVTGGDYEAFIQMMNDRAKELGCTETNFTNSHGLPDENHVTSAHDMGLIACEAIKNDMFRTLCSTIRYDLPATNMSDPLVMFNNHKMICSAVSMEYLYEDAIGGKTGYTDAAGNTLVTYAERDGMLLVCVVFKCAAGTQYTDTRALMEYCFDNFKVCNVADNETRYSSEAQGTSTMMSQNEAFAELDEDAVIVLPKDADFMDTTTEVTYDTAGEDGMGSLVYTYGDRVVGQADVVLTNAKVNGFDFTDGETTDVDPSDLNVLQGEIEEEKHVGSIVVIVIVVIGLAVFLYFVVRARMSTRHWRNVRHPDRQFVKIQSRKRRRRRRRRY